MSQPASTDPTRGIAVQKPKADIYTFMLGVALVAILMAILFLCLEMQRYDWKIEVPPSDRYQAPALSSIVPALNPFRLT